MDTSPQFRLHKILLILFFLPSLLLSSPVSINLYPLLSQNFTFDYGRITENKPIAVLKPKTAQDIAILLRSIGSSPAYNNITIAPRGAGHSTYGQGHTSGGIVVDMLSFPSSIQVSRKYVDAGGGALWVDVLKETLKHGLTPRSWTDYLYLTVGGTLSVGGISGQAFKYGPQISNVIELEVVTGKGGNVTCSKEKNSDLFYGTLGGLGQFGIITRARIILELAPKMVKWVRVSYYDFDRFRRDQELLILNGTVDYLEGFLHFQSKKGRLSGHSMKHLHFNLSKDGQLESREVQPYYSIELAIYYADDRIVQETLHQVLSQLSFRRMTLNETDVSYFDFLNRVRATELELRKRGQWEVAHPWLNLFVPRVQIKRFKDLLLATISDSHISGPIIMYPILRHKWNLKMSTMLPKINQEDDIVYVVSVLRSAPPSCTAGSQCLDALLRQNQKIIDIATSETEQRRTLKQDAVTLMGTAKHPCTGEDFREHVFIDKMGKGEPKAISSEIGMGAKQYLPYWKNEEEWRTHFGDSWERFKKLKERFDPLHIVTPGQRIFKRKQIDS